MTKPRNSRYGRPETRRRANQALAVRNQQAGVRTVRLPADVIAGLDKVARSMDITRTEAATLALREWLAKQEI